MADCLLGLGANQGDRIAQLNRSIALLCGHPQIHLLRGSRYYETRPVGGPGNQNSFLNATVRIATTLAPDALLAWTRHVEQQLGRSRTQRWGPRLMDIDLLLYDHVSWQSASLIIPHPRMAVRRFVLQPAAEIAPEMIHVTTGLTVGRLLARLDEPPWYVAIAGTNRSLCSWLAERAAARCGAQLLSWGRESAATSSNDGDARHRQSTDQHSPALHDSLERALERLRQQRHLLSSVEWDTGEQRAWWISDFWLKRTLIEFRNSLLGSDRPEFALACKSIAADAPEPKFILSLDGIAAQRVGQTSASASSTLPEAEPTPRDGAVTAHALNELVMQPGHVPVIPAAESDPDWALIELTAAIDAMR